MKINIIVDPMITENELMITCQEKNTQIEQIVSYVEISNQHIIGKKNDVNHILLPHEIYYFESVDDKVFCYTERETYETKYKLYELESLLPQTIFVRINKSMVLNIKKIKTFKSTLNGRMEALLHNKERVEVSRTYVLQLKSTLGGR